MPRLTEDLIVEILVKLPVKSLLRFRCVCKAWLDLFRSPYFISRHLEHHSTKDNGCSIIIAIRGHQDDDDDDQTSILSLHSSLESLINNAVSPNLLTPHQLENFSIKYFWPCNGLVCLSDGTRFVLCNPAMREFRSLPPPPFPGPGPEGRRSRTETTGFGFDLVSKDYKVVTIVRLYLSYAFGYVHKVTIYNLMANSWREINHNIPKASHFSGDGTLLNGVFHWIVWSKGESKSEHFQLILCFNMSSEVFQSMELPGHDDPPAKFRRGLHLTVLNESLAFLGCTGYTYPCIPEDFFDVWVMHDYGVAQSWTKQYVIGPVTGIHHPLLLWKNEVILIESSEGRRLVSCELNTRERNYFEIHGDLRVWGLIICKESLIAIK